MVLTTTDFTEADAKEVCLWHYESPYDIYNCPDWETVQAQKWGMANAMKRKKEFHSIKSDQQLVGFFRLKDQGESVMIGLGLAPEMCGQGIGKQVMSLIKETLNREYPDKTAYLEVRDFNTRAIKCYENSGFVIKERYNKETPIGDSDFIMMELA